MTYVIQKTQESRFDIKLESEAPNCHALATAPDHREPELDSGVWVVASYALWSGPDLECLKVTLNVARHFIGFAEFGLRLFEDFSEFDTWCPELVHLPVCPVWLFFRDSTLMRQHRGLLSESQLYEMANEHIQLS
jgi:hypothetical protein